MTYVLSGMLNPIILYHIIIYCHFVCIDNYAACVNISYKCKKNCGLYTR